MILWLSGISRGKEKMWGFFEAFLSLLPPELPNFEPSGPKTGLQVSMLNVLALLLFNSVEGLIGFHQGNQDPVGEGVDAPKHAVQDDRRTHHG